MPRTVRFFSELYVKRRAGAFVFFVTFLRPLRTSWLIVGTATCFSRQRTDGGSAPPRRAALHVPAGCLRTSPLRGRTKGRSLIAEPVRRALRSRAAGRRSLCAGRCHFGVFRPVCESGAIMHPAVRRTQRRILSTVRFRCQGIWRRGRPGRRSAASKWDGRWRTRDAGTSCSANTHAARRPVGRSGDSATAVGSPHFNPH